MGIHTDVNMAYSEIWEEETYQELADFYGRMQIAKKKAEQAYKDAQGNQADANKGNQPDNASTDKDASAGIDTSTLAA